MKTIKYLASLASILCVASACHNSDVEFEDYDYSAVYFASQYPARTLVLGDDIYDNTLDNAHQLDIYATVGGLYKNDNCIDIAIEIDNTLCDNLYLADGTTPIVAMPESYYTIESNKISLDKSMAGAVRVNLKPEFFEDPKAVTSNYAIPVKMTSVSGADKILSGEAMTGVENPVSCNINDWKVAPKDYVLYIVNYMNPYQAAYLRRGEDVITEGGVTATSVRHKEYVEYDEVVELKTKSMNETIMPIALSYSDSEGSQKAYCDMVLTFDEEGKCTLSTENSDFKVSGNGAFVKNGEKNSWGNRDRSALYLKYDIELDGKVQYQVTDTLVVRNRGMAVEFLNPVYKE